MKEVDTNFSVADSELVSYSYSFVADFFIRDILYFSDQGTLEISAFIEESGARYIS